MLFVGQYPLKIDRKGKVSLPQSFVQLLEKQSFQGLYIFRSSCGRYIEATSEAWMMHLSKNLENEGAFDGLDHPKIYSIYDQVVPIPLEKNGRITIPESFLTLLPNRNLVTIVGYGYRFGIWSASNYQQYLSKIKQKTIPIEPEQETLVQELVDSKNSADKASLSVSGDNSLLSADDTHTPSAVTSSQKKENKKLLNLSKYKARNKRKNKELR